MSVHVDRRWEPLFGVCLFTQDKKYGKGANSMVLEDETEV